MSYYLTDASYSAIISVCFCCFSLASSRQLTRTSNATYVSLQWTTFSSSSLRAHGQFLSLKIITSTGQQSHFLSRLLQTDKCYENSSTLFKPRTSHAGHAPTSPQHFPKWLFSSPYGTMPAHRGHANFVLFRQSFSYLFNCSRENGCKRHWGQESFWSFWRVAQGPQKAVSQFWHFKGVRIISRQIQQLKCLSIFYVVMLCSEMSVRGVNLIDLPLRKLVTNSLLKSSRHFICLS
jgi:hypothetical protein